MEYITGNERTSNADRLYLLVRGKQMVRHYDRRRIERIRIDGIADICRMYWPASDGGDVEVYLVDERNPFRLVPVFGNC